MYRYSQDATPESLANHENSCNRTDRCEADPLESKSTVNSADGGRSLGVVPSKAGTLHDQLTRLRRDLDEAWQRLEHLESLLREEPETATHMGCDEPEAEMEDEFQDTESTSEEKAIRDYMERLLQRVGTGDSPPTESPACQVSCDEQDLVGEEPAEVDAHAPASAAESLSKSPFQMPLLMVDGDAKRVSRGDADHHRQEANDLSLPAEPLIAEPPHADFSPVGDSSGSDPRPEDGIDGGNTTDIRAMRALANVAAKTVIIEFESKQHAKLAMDKLLVMLVCLPCGMLLLYWYSVHKLGVTYIAASIAFFAVAIWGAQALRFLAKLTAARQTLARLWRDPEPRQ